MTDLKPCPFCGKMPYIFTGVLIKEDAVIYQVYCNNANCAMQPSTMFQPKKQMAIDEWNERVKA